MPRASKQSSMRHVYKAATVAQVRAACGRARASGGHVTVCAPRMRVCQVTAVNGQGRILGTWQMRHMAGGGNLWQRQITTWRNY